MVTTSEIAPSPVLAPFVRCYSYREFDTNSLDLIKPSHASHELYISFFLKAKPREVSNIETGKILKDGGNVGFTGLGTQYNGEIVFNGAYAFFGIRFKPNGFNKVFRAPPGELNNQNIYADNIFDMNFKLLFEQLSMAKGLNEMVSLANTYLLYYLKRQKSVEHKDAITRISNLILKNAGVVNINKLAYDANMSIKSFERHFTEQVGISPKLFSRITRFNHAFAVKLKNPEEDWSSIALYCGYFDQMHLIKDFKIFSGSSPSNFIKQTPLTKEVYTCRVEV